MKSTLRAVLSVLLIITSGIVTAGPELQIGDPAPAFSLAGSDGKTYTLAQFRDKKGVVIAFFPKVFTGG
jgi:peroxiredoxin Q/BCP